MKKLWAGSLHSPLDQAAEDFNASINVDARMYREDIQGSLAHAAMLARQGIISPEDGEQIRTGLETILAELEDGTLEIDRSAEDIHTFVEAELTRRIGDAGRRLHTARSRNDQVATDLRLYLRGETKALRQLLKDLIAVLCDKAETWAETPMPGYTHLQRAQPVTFGHYLLAYGMMFARDLERLGDTAKRINVSPLGACALAGTTYPTDRGYTADLLGFDSIALNSIDAVSDRDFALELLSDLCLIMMHLSRFCEELILWASSEFGFISFGDTYTTGSSIMPQKKNPDFAELIRGKTGRVYGSLMALLTTLKGLPLAYNKDMQEDKEQVFDSVDQTRACLTIFTRMLATIEPRPERMRQAAQGGFINATDLADYLTRKGLPFRSAYELTGDIVAHCTREGRTLEDLTLEEYQGFSDLFDEDLYDAIKLENCIQRRSSAGGPSLASVRQQITYLRSIV